jgi:ribonuclease D
MYFYFKNKLNKNMKDKKNKKQKLKRTKEERLNLVVTIINKLKKFPRSDNNKESPHINLYNDEYDAIKELKKIFKEYITQNDEYANSYSGKIKFVEINRIIEYILPINPKNEPVFVLRYVS